MLKYNVYSSAIYNQILPSLTNKNSITPHCLFELSVREFNRIKTNNINLKGCYRTKEKEKRSRCTYYRNVTFGSLIKKKRIMFPVNQSNFHAHEIQIEQIDRNYIINTMEKSECTVAFDNTIIIDASYGVH